MDIKSFLFGFSIGILFIIAIIALSIFIANKRFINKSIHSNLVENKDVKSMISDKHKRILKSTKIGLEPNMTLVKDLSIELIQEIATYYYPNSKYPHYEINFIEALDMNERIIERLKKILDMKGFGILKQIRISQIIYVLDVKKTIENHKIYQFSKKYHFDQVLKAGYTALNVANPGYWIRKLIFTSTLETTLRGISVMTLNIIGQESKRLYSKKIEDNSDKLLEKELLQFIKEIEA